MTDDEFKKNLFGSWQSPDFSLDVTFESDDETGQTLEMTIIGPSEFKEILRLSSDLGHLTTLKKNGSVQTFERDSAFSWIDPSDKNWHRLSFDIITQAGHEKVLKITAQDEKEQKILPDLVFFMPENKN